MTIQLPNDRFTSPRSGGLYRGAAAVLGALVVSSLALACGGGSSAWQPGAGGEAGGDTGNDVGTGGKSGHASNIGPTEAGGDSSNAEGGSPIVNCDDRPTQTVKLDQPIWQSGFKVTLRTATLKPQTPSCTPGIVTIDAQFENRGTDTETFDAETLLSSAGKDYELRARDLPDVPGGRLGKGGFTFAVDDTFSFDDAVLSFGGAQRHQAKVPFGKSAPDPLVTLEPQTLPIKGKVVAGYLVVNFEDAYVRADSAGSYSSLSSDELHLSLDFSAMVTKDLNRSDELVARAFVLQLPDGTSIAPDHTPGVSLDKKGVTVSDIWVGFTIPAPAAGKYSLEVREYDYVSQTASAVFPFTLPSFPTFGDK
ncbi:MAG TPA: hypothetical protein VHB79_19570 [Polyangiaceae bacterium]|nr:hypothetical protein [Polyangiaceae bacterium]